MTRLCSRAISSTFSSVCRDIHCARRIARIDQQDRPRLRIDPSLDVRDVRLPAIRLVEVVSVGHGAQLRQHRAVQRILRTRRQHVFAGIHQRREATVDDLSAAVAHEDALNVFEPVRFGLMADGVHRRLDAQRLAIAVMAIQHRLVHRFDHVRRCGEVELTRVADVQVKDLVSLARDFVGDDGKISNGVAHIGHALRGDNFSGGLGWHDDVLQKSGFFPTAHYLLSLAALKGSLFLTTGTVLRWKRQASAWRTRRGMNAALAEGICWRQCNDARAVKSR